MNSKIEEIENEDSDSTDSDDDDGEKSHFQFEGTDWFQGVHQTTVLIQNKNSTFNQKFEK